VQLVGLRPGTEYSYRVAIQSVYTPNGEPLRGVARTFTTEGLVEVLKGLPPVTIVLIPSMSFPGADKSKASCKHGFKRDRHRHCVRKSKKRRRRGT
jgi:hypothetical protein